MIYIHSNFHLAKVSYALSFPTFLKDVDIVVTCFPFLRKPHRCNDITVIPFLGGYIYIVLLTRYPSHDRYFFRFTLFFFELLEAIFPEVRESLILASGAP